MVNDDGDPWPDCKVCGVNGCPEHVEEVRAIEDFWHDVALGLEVAE